MMLRFLPRMFAALLLALCLPVLAAKAQDTGAQLPPRAAPTKIIPVSSLPVLNTTPKFDALKATNAYLAQISGPARARSDAYFEGGYWLLLWDMLYAVVLAALLLWLRISTWLRDWAAERSRNRSAQVVLYVAAYVLITTAATFPMSVYEGFAREHAYGLSNQDFSGWLGDFAIGVAINLAGALIIAPLIYWAIRRARETWWLWGAGITIAFMIVQVVIYPVFIAPLTNHYTPLADSPLKQEILSLARANAIPAENVWQFDASRQSNRISANVSGFLGATRISLTDNLLKQGSRDQALAVLGHEMGHYAMGHMVRMILLLSLVIIAGFAFANWGYIALINFFGGNWNVRRVDDVAGLPLLMALAAIYGFLVTPLTNTITRTTEQQADIFGVNAVRKPDAFAQTVLKLSSYRKLDPGKWEEIIFFDHPSGRTRIMTMMVWKKEHIRDTDIRDTVSPQ